MGAQASAIVSYSHDSSAHNERVVLLAERLRADGVNCDLDAYQVSPAEGWPGWMRRQLQERDFCLAVCTATYARRFAGDEQPGAGKGATWEGRLLRQILYEEGKNDHVIPIVFDLADLQHIPLELKDATYYDLSTEEGYYALHRALTRQPLVERPEIGPVRRHLPLLTPAERVAVALLAACPDPVPVEVIARVAAIPLTGIETTLQRLVGKGFVALGGDCISLPDRSVGGLPGLTGASADLGLQALLDFVHQRHREIAARTQLSNVVALVRTVDPQVSARQVSRAFAITHLLLKARGDKRLVLEIARRSIEASRIQGRGQEQARDEALAVICGVSWVYQRTARLDQARVEAENSLKLGLAINWDRNTAFCNKCLGRLLRMQAESAGIGRDQSELLAESQRLLADAVEQFTALGIEGEVGDCYSLLARTHLVAGNLREAREAVRHADERLVEPGSKDYLDLLIVKGDLTVHSNRRGGESIYSEVIAHVPGEDAQRSEIIARAYLQRGRVRAGLREPAGALSDFRLAAEIWDALEDPSADLAHWEIERAADLLDRDAQRLLDSEPVAVRVRVARAVRQQAESRTGATANRSKLPEKYLRGLVREARERLAVERPDW